MISCWDRCNCSSIVLSWDSPVQEKLSPVRFLILKYGVLSSLMWFSSLNLQPKCLKKSRIDGENVRYCSHLKCFKATQVTWYRDQIIVMEGAWCSSVLVIHIIIIIIIIIMIIIITIAISIFTSFVICSFIFLFNLFIVTLFHDCTNVNVLCTLRTLFSVKSFNIILNRFPHRHYQQLPTSQNILSTKTHSTFSILPPCCFY